MNGSTTTRRSEGELSRKLQTIRRAISRTNEARRAAFGAYTKASDRNRLSPDETSGRMLRRANTRLRDLWAELEALREAEVYVMAKIELVKVTRTRTDAIKREEANDEMPSM